MTRIQDMNSMHDETSSYHDLKWLAYWLARYLLRNRVDKQGRPLIEHSMRVTARCADMGLSDEQQIAAILHDCYEDGEAHPDCKLSAYYAPRNHVFNIIHALFGSSVSRLVLVLSRRVGTNYEEYIRVIGLYPGVVPIKLADLADNLDPSRGPIPDSLRERYEKARDLLESKTGDANG